MSRFIDADKLIDYIDCGHLRPPTELAFSEMDIVKMIKKQPAADVVEVVRCKDCRHHEELLNNNDGNVLCWVHGLDVIVDRTGYCNYGEREEQENEGSD